MYGRFQVRNRERFNLVVKPNPRPSQLTVNGKLRNDEITRKCVRRTLAYAKRRLSRRGNLPANGAQISVLFSTTGALDEIKTASSICYPNPSKRKCRIAMLLELQSTTLRGKLARAACAVVLTPPASVSAKDPG
ncbi:hypothetical protein EVAR_41034_1 [Eumeta japonica]|uniref:Uncharacterized protein n=1 Tax=Eumeta variegata TaxID=151549 RepID=A0A4C1YY87_EUMVA|nr:hypothetical protein EVAR_41034_1 [Eumeta japonica]